MGEKERLGGGSRLTEEEEEAVKCIDFFSPSSLSSN